MSSEPEGSPGRGRHPSKVEAELSKQSSRKRRRTGAPVGAEHKDESHPPQIAEEGARTGSSIKRKSRTLSDNRSLRSTGSSTSRVKGEAIKVGKMGPSSDGPPPMREKPEDAMGTEAPSPRRIVETLPSQQVRDKDSSLKQSRRKATGVATSVDGSPTGGAVKLEDAIGTATSEQPTAALAATSIKEGNVQPIMASQQGSAALPSDLAAASSGLNTARSEETTGRTRSSKVKPKTTILSPTLGGLKNFDLADIVRSPRETFTSTAALLLKNEIVISLVVIATMLCVVVLLYFLIQATTPKIKDAFCVTDDCLSHASLLKAARTTKFDPCHDFSAHVCFNWSPPKRREGIRDFDTSTMEDMVYSWLLDMSTALQEGTTTFPVANKALAMLESCMSNSSTYGTTLESFRQFLNDRSLLWPEPPRKDTDALRTLITLAYNWQAAFWFEVRVFLVRKGAYQGRWSIRLTPAPLITHYRRQHQAVLRDGKDAYYKYWMDFYNALFGDKATASKERALQAADIEGDILDTLNDALQASPKDSAVFPIGELEVYTNGISSDRWLQQLQNTTHLNPKLDEQDVAVTTNVRFLQAVGGLFAKYTNDKILDYLGWQFAQHYGPVSDSGLLVALYGDRRTATSLRPAFCGFHIEVPYKVLLLTQRFALRLTQSDKELVDAGFDRLVSTAVRLVNDSTWLDSDSRALAADKLRSASLRLWPPAEFLNETNLEELFRAFPEREESFGAYFINSRRSIRMISRTPEFDSVLGMPENYALPYFDYDYVDNAVGAAISAVARPLFYSKGTTAMFYGGFGFSVALELVKALDQEGLQWHPDGRVVDSFLSARSQAVYRAKNRCFNRSELEAANSVFPEIPALQIAYSAFRDAADEAGNSTKLSAELTEERVFFMTICHMTCSRQDVKNPFAVDCNKIARHSPAFAKAFRCSEGSRMNPRNKCVFFD